MGTNLTVSHHPAKFDGHGHCGIVIVNNTFSLPRNPAKPRDQRFM